MIGSNGVEYNNFDKAAQAIWAEPDLEKKKKMVLETVITQFQFKKKTDHFLNEVQKATSGTRLDKLVTDLALLQSGDRVIK